LVDKARNDLSAAVPKFCLALEEHRRTPDGRVRTSQELLTAFFPYDDKTSVDKIFRYLPNEVRGPIIAAWGIRGIKAALRDNDERVQQVVYDALVAGDVDHAAFEEGLGPETLVRWLPLSDLWAFWRGGKLTKQAIHKAMATAYELYLFDARWFLDTINAKGGALRGTDVLADQLTKDDLTQWIRRVHETGDGTPKGLVSALGWDKIVAKTPNDVLVAVLDAMVGKVGLVTAPAAAASSPSLPNAAAQPKAEAKAEPPKQEPKPEPPPAAAATPVPASAAPEPPARLSGWPTEPPGPDLVADPTSAAAGDPPIDVAFEEDVVIADRALPTSPRIRTASPVDEEDTEVKRLERRSARPGPDNKTSRR
jgi:hypothetical protein